MPYPATQVDLQQWPRAQHFAFFKDFHQPYFNVCVRLDARLLFAYCQAQALSFFSAYIYLVHKSAQQYWPMGLRIVDDQPVHYQQVTMSVVQLAEDDSFRFSYLDDTPCYASYAQRMCEEKARAANEPLFSEAFARTEGRADVLHVSVLPWLQFSSFSHATCLGATHGIPKVVLGQYDKVSGCMPLALDVHHALMDGLHSAKYIQVLQEMMHNPSDYL